MVSLSEVGTELEGAELPLGRGAGLVRRSRGGEGNHHVFELGGQLLLS